MGHSLVAVVEADFCGYVAAIEIFTKEYDEKNRKRKYFGFHKFLKCYRIKLTSTFTSNTSPTFF